MAQQERVQAGEEIYTNILTSLELHERHRSHCINMIASENVVSPAARRVTDSDLGNRYTVGPNERLFPGLVEYTEIERVAVDMLKDVLSAEYVTVQPVTGMNANQVAYHALIERGDTVLAVSEKCGGHYSHKKGDLGAKRPESLLDMYGANVNYLPFDAKEYNLDLEASRKMILKEKPKLLIVGASEMLFPIKLKELREMADIVGAQILYDAAHVFGLIIGGIFQDPLNEGADMISSSTNKTLGAPCHGIVACNNTDRYQKWIEHALVPLFTSNHHAQNVAGLAVTLAEMKEFGHDYATQVVKNSKALGLALSAAGVNVVAADRGFSESHIVLIDTKLDNSKPVMQKLADSNIIVSQSGLPCDKNENDTGLRLGTAEMTRMGMKEPEMKVIAGLIGNVIFNRNGAVHAKQQVYELRESFQEQKYCFKV